MRHRRHRRRAASRRAGDLADVRRHPAPGARRLGHLRRGRRRPRHAPAQHHRPRRRAPADRATRTEPAGRASTARSTTTRSSGRTCSHADTGSAPGPTPRSWSTSTRTRASGCSQRLRGMFAFAIWDRRRRRLFVARDHFGQKPLFYTERGGRLTFASEIKALLASDPTLGALSPVALDQYLTLRFVQAPDTFFEGVRALPPAHFLVWENGRRPHRAVLGPELRPQVDLLRGRDARADRRAARRDRPAPPDERRAGRGVPERRARLDPDRLLRRQGPRPGASHLLDGHPLSGPERAAGRGRRGASIRHPALRRRGHADGR